MFISENFIGIRVVCNRIKYFYPKNEMCVCVYLGRRKKVRLAFYPTFMIRNGCVNSREVKRFYAIYILR